MNLRKRKVTFSDFQMLDSDEIEEELEKEEGVTKKKSASMKVKDLGIRRNRQAKDEAQLRLLTSENQELKKRERKEIQVA